MGRNRRDRGNRDDNRSRDNENQGKPKDGPAATPPPPAPEASPPPPASAPAAPTQAERFAESLEPTVERAVRRFIEELLTEPSITRIIQRLPADLVSLIGEFGPNAIGYLVGSIPNAFLGGSIVLTHVFKNALNEAGKVIGDTLKEISAGQGGQPLPPEEQKKKADEAKVRAGEMLNQVLNATYRLDPTGALHTMECPTLKIWPKSQLITDTTLAKALQLSKLNICGTCLGAVSNDLAALAKAKLDEEKAKQSAKGSAGNGQSADFRNCSAFDVIGQMGPADQVEFTRWIASLTPEQRHQGIQALQELDSMIEVKGFLAMDPAIRLEMLPLLVNRELKTSGLKGFLKDVGTAIKSAGGQVKQGLTQAWAEFKKFDAGLAPYVREQQAIVARPLKRDGFLAKLAKSFLPF